MGSPLNVKRGADLNARELQILDGLAHGLTAPELAAKLHVTEHTIRTYTKRVRMKLGARNAPHAVAIAFMRGYLRVIARERVL